MPDKLQIRIKNDVEFNNAMRRKAAALTDMREPMDRVLDMQIKSIIDGTLKKQRMTEDKGSRPFPPLKPRYKARKEKRFPGAPILKATGEMLAKARFSKKILTTIVHTMGRLIWTGPRRGIVHQEGNRKVKVRMRKWFGFRANDKKNIVSILKTKVRFAMRA